MEWSGTWILRILTEELATGLDWTGSSLEMELELDAGFGWPIYFLPSESEVTGTGSPPLPVPGVPDRVTIWWCCR